MSYFTYILECADRSFYVGCTNNLKKHLKEHNESKWGAHYTKLRRPVILLYFEKFATLKEARRREIEIKGWRREKKLNLINKIAAARHLCYNKHMMNYYGGMMGWGGGYGGAFGWISELVWLVAGIMLIVWLWKQIK